MTIKENSTDLILQETITNRIFLIREKRVMLDRDLAELYGVETRVLLQAVKRNAKRFPEDFMFQLSQEEDKSLRSHFVTLKLGRGQHRKYLPYVFTEQGVAMLSGVLNSDRAIMVNIQIMRVFTKIGEMLATHADLRKKIEDMEAKYDAQFKVVFDALKQLINPPAGLKKRIGFQAGK